MRQAFSCGPFLSYTPHSTNKQEISISQLEEGLKSSYAVANLKFWSLRYKVSEVPGIHAFLVEDVSTCSLGSESLVTRPTPVIAFCKCSIFWQINLNHLTWNTQLLDVLHMFFSLSRCCDRGKGNCDLFLNGDATVIDLYVLPSS